MTRFIFLGKAKDVFNRLHELVGAKSPEPEPKVIYQTTIITPGMFIWKKVPFVGRVPS